MTSSFTIGYPPPLTRSAQRRAGDLFERNKQIYESKWGPGGRIDTGTPRGSGPEAQVARPRAHPWPTATRADSSTSCGRHRRHPARGNQAGTGDTSSQGLPEAEPLVVATAQHRGLLDQAFERSGHRGRRRPRPDDPPPDPRWASPAAVSSHLTR